MKVDRTKRVDTARTPDGRYVFLIGERDEIVSGFGCFYEDYRSGDWSRVKKDGELVVKYTDGQFFDSRSEALGAGRIALSDGSWQSQ